MRSSLRLLAVLNVVFLLSAIGCGDEDGGCGPAPEKKEEAPAGGGMSGNTGNSSRAAELITSDKKGRVPEQYRRVRTIESPAKSTATISKPVIAVSSVTVSTAAAVTGAAVPAPAPAATAKRAASLPLYRIIRRRVDGVVDRVEVSCRLLASSPDGTCASAANYLDIKLRCCPGGQVERCRTGSSGVVLVGRGCQEP